MVAATGAVFTLKVAEVLLAGMVTVAGTVTAESFAVIATVVGTGAGTVIVTVHFADWLPTIVAGEVENDFIVIGVTVRLAVQFTPFTVAVILAVVDAVTAPVSTVKAAVAVLRRIDPPAAPTLMLSFAVVNPENRLPSAALT